MIGLKRIGYLFLGHCLVVSNLTSQISTKVDPILFAYQPDQKFSFLAIMGEQADLSAAKFLRTKAAKGQFVMRELTRTSERTQTGLLHYLSRVKVDFKRYYVVNAIRITGTINDVIAVANFEEVARIEPDLSIVAGKNPQKVIASTRDDHMSWGLSRIKADSVWAIGIKGQGVVIGGEDTGVDWEHEAIRHRYRGNTGGAIQHDFNWHDAIHEIDPVHGDSIFAPENNPCGINSKIPCDDHNHGTHTIGTMVGLSQQKIIGVAPEAQWIGCRCMERGAGRPSTYIECFEWFLAPTNLMAENPDPSLAPDIINNSWSCPVEEGCNASNFETMLKVLENLRAAGIFIVSSAGNRGAFGCSTIASPIAIFDPVLTVGATNENDSITSFSSKGPVLADGSGRLKPDIVAPGQNILSAVRDNKYAAWNGTSMAAPHVAGTVALILSANPGLSGNVDAIEQILYDSALKIDFQTSCDTSTGIPNQTYGFGRVDAFQAVNIAMSIPTSVNRFNDGGFAVYPNPFSDHMTILDLQRDQSNQYILYDLMGIPIQRGNFDLQYRMTTTFLPAGAYFLHISSESVNHVFKVLKK